MHLINVTIWSGENTVTGFKWSYNVKLVFVFSPSAHLQTFTEGRFKFIFADNQIMCPLLACALQNIHDIPIDKEDTFFLFLHLST